MHRRIALFVCLLAAGAAGAASPRPPACPGLDGIDTRPLAVAAMRARVDAAVMARDNARVALPAAMLATGRLSHVSVSVALPDRLDQIRVLGYFMLAGRPACTIALLVDHVETIRPEHGRDPDHPGAEQARIHFMVPDVDAFTTTLGVYQHMTLRIAVFAVVDGQPDAPYFGRELHFATASRDASIGATLLFALGFYLLTTTSVAAIPGRDSGVPRGAVARARLLARLRRLAPWHLVAEGTGTALAQLQMLLFTLIVAALLFYQWMRTGQLDDLSTDLLYLIGISALGATGSELAASMKRGLDPALYAYVQRLEWFTAPLQRAQHRFDPVDLLMTDRRFDIYKFQMVVFSCVIAAYIIDSGADELATLHISAALLTLMGISQGAYVGGHMTSDALSVLQDQLRGMQSLQERYRQSSDPRVRDLLRRRFRLSAAHAGAGFGVLFGRTLPGHMLEMPVDADHLAHAQAALDDDGEPES